MGWSSIVNNVSLEPIILYVAAIFWTLGYDTIYGLQDVKDDEIIGVKSTSIRFKNNVKTFVGICYGFCIFFISISFFLMNTKNSIFLLAIFFILTLIYQIKIFNKNYSKSCLTAFKNNNLTGMFIFIFIFSFIY